MDSNRSTWAKRLTAMAGQPLEYRRDFADVSGLWERWWNFEAERPLVVGSVAKSANSPALKRGKAFDLLESPGEWLRVREDQVEETYWIDASIPCIRVDIGPVCVGAFLGAPLEFANEEETSWQKPILTGDWSGEVPELDEANRWLEIVVDLARRTAAAGKGRYIVSLPDLSGAVDILANLRGTERLLFDLYDRPEAVVRAAAAINDRWKRVFELLYDAITSSGNGVTTWLGAWSSSPYTLSTNDFNYMISEPQFREFCLPSIVEQAKRAGRFAIHMDGPGAVKHMDALVETPEITAVQFTPGAGTPSALAWLPTWHMLQDADKPIALACPAEEVAELCARLDPRGLLLLPGGVDSVAAAHELEAIVAK